MTTSLTIYFDGLCHLCSREIDHYRRRTVGLPVSYVDITDPQFDPVALGLDPKRVQKHLHARLNEQLRIGVDAFLAIWSVVPGYRWMNRLVSCPGIYQLAKAAYWLFAIFRPWLPKRRRELQECTTHCQR